MEDTKELSYELINDNLVLFKETKESNQVKYYLGVKCHDCYLPIAQGDLKEECLLEGLKLYSQKYHLLQDELEDFIQKISYSTQNYFDFREDLEIAGISSKVTGFDEIQIEDGQAFFINGMCIIQE